MLPTTQSFYLFLFTVLAVYHLLRSRKWKYRTLLLASWGFYAATPPHYLWVLLLLTGIDYLSALRIAQSENARVRKRWLLLSISANLLLLGAFKYTGFLHDVITDMSRTFGEGIPRRTWEILLPLGISFHTFQGISYTVDVYRRQIAAVESFVDYAFFVSFFPQLAAGPIVRAVEFLPQMVEPPKVTEQQITDGIVLFAFGLFKKAVIADNLDRLIVTPVFAAPAEFDESTLRWAALAWTVQMYCDFSGYTDIAIGVGKGFGFELPPNFQRPYLATSITDFWRRWHLSLSTWLRDYLYFPLGGSRGSTWRTYFNLVFIFVICGLWHGASWQWVAYGFYNGILMALHRAFDRATTTGILGWLRTTWGWKLLAWLMTFLQLMIGLILIRMTDWTGGKKIIVSLFHWNGESLNPLSVSGIVPLLVVLGLSGHLVGSCRWLPSFLRIGGAALALVAVVIFRPDTTKTFIYIQF